MTDAHIKPAFGWLLLGSIVSLYSALAYLIPPGADTLWRLHVATGLLNGQTFYRDMIEVNPPLWFWSAIPAALLGGYAALIVINLLVSLIGSGLFYRLLCFTMEKGSARAGTLGLAFGLFVVNVAEVGQREQAFLLAAALWSALAAARIEGQKLPLLLVVTATCFAAYGFALKHYFVLVPIAIELLIIAHQRRTWRPFRPETLLLSALAIMYGFAVVFITPDYLGRALDLVRASYFGFGPWNELGPVERQVRLAIQCSFVVIPLVALYLTRTAHVAVRVLLVALMMSILVVMLQQKGWRYHLIAARGLSIIMVCMIWLQLLQSNGPNFARRFVPLGLAVLLWTAGFQPAISSVQTHGQPIDPVLTQIVSQQPRDHHLVILSTAPDNAFYPLARAGRMHWSRHYSMWMIPGLLTPQKEPKREALRLTQQALVLKEFTSDIMCVPPDMIIGEVGYFRNPEPTLFVAIDFLNKDPVFAAWLAKHYRRGSDIGRYPVWRLATEKPVSQHCF